MRNHWEAQKNPVAINDDEDDDDLQTIGSFTASAAAQARFHRPNADSNTIKVRTKLTEEYRPSQPPTTSAPNSHSADFAQVMVDFQGTTRVKPLTCATPS
jgi:hypothetical protein